MILLFGGAARSSPLPLMQPHLLPLPPLLMAGEKTGLVVIYYWQSHQISGFYTPVQTDEGGEVKEEKGTRGVFPTGSYKNLFLLQTNNVKISLTAKKKFHPLTTCVNSSRAKKIKGANVSLANITLSFWSAVSCNNEEEKQKVSLAGSHFCSLPCSFPPPPCCVIMFGRRMSRFFSRYTGRVMCRR